VNVLGIVVFNAAQIVGWYTPRYSTPQQPGLSTYSYRILLAMT